MSAAGLLNGIRVVDLSHHYSGALAACLLADFGADVIAVEHPSGSPMRTLLPKKDGESLWWKVVARGKRAVTLDLSRPAGRELVLKLVASADVLVENFRPGTLERWGLGPDDLADVRESLVMLRISGFGQTGPMRDRPGFGTVAESISGFAHLNGSPDGPPVFPATALADGAAATFGALGVLAALTGAASTPTSGVQVVDVALFEALFRLIPVQIASFDQLGFAPKRPGNFLGSHGVLRNLYRTRDDVYFSVSAIGEKPIDRILLAAGARDLADEVVSAIARGQNGFEEFLHEADARVAAWAKDEPWETVAKRLSEEDAVFQRVYSAEEIFADPLFREREDIISVPDSKLGPILMQGVMPKFPGREHAVHSAGPALGQHNREVYTQLASLTKADLDALRDEGVI